jgi:hypothetical protein
MQENIMKQRSKKLLKPEYADLQIYRLSEDIYQQLKRKRFEPRRYYKNKAPNEKEGTWNERALE